MTHEPKSPIVGLIWVQTLNRVIGAHGDLPWHLPEDLKFFKRTTMGHPVIMGRSTWESIPDVARPFSGRTSIVLSRDPQRAASFNGPPVIGVTNIDDAMTAARAAEGSEEIWIIGGGEVFEQTLHLANVAEITTIRSTEIWGDTHAPELDENWKLVRGTPDADTSADSGWLTSGKGLQYRIDRWEKQC